MAALQLGDRSRLEIAPNLWAGVGLVRGGAGTALVGDPEQVAARVRKYAGLGIDTFMLSGYPHLEETGEFLAIVGRSGSGKTTLLRLIAGLERPGEGEIRQDGSPCPGLTGEPGSCSRTPGSSPGSGWPGTLAWGSRANSPGGSCHPCIRSG